MDNSELQSQTLVDHLTELRQRLINSILFITVGFFASWAFSEQIFDIVRRPISPYLATATKGLIFTSPMDKFLAHIKVSMLAGVVLTTPFWLYQVWAFVAPGLYKREKGYALSFIAFGTVLFGLGVSFVYFLVFPMAFEFLMSFGGTTDAPMITIAEYLSFFLTTTVVFGLAFELPLILTLLGMLGVIDHHFLISKRRYAFMLLAVVSAVITPPDALSMMMMMVPLTLLYEISILLVRWLAVRPSVEEL